MNVYDLWTLDDWVRRLYAAAIGSNDRRVMWLEPFGYPFLASSFVGATGSSTGTLAINSNHDFVLTRISLAAQLASVQTVSSQPLPQLTMQVTDAGSARPFWNAAVNVNTVCAIGNQQKVLPYPRFLGANTSLAVALTGVAGAAETYTRVDLTFEGVNVRVFSGGMVSPSIPAPSIDTASVMGGYNG